MIDAFWQAVSFDGLPILIFAVVLAGVVRGFAGFGTALIYLPFASQVLPPIWVLISIVAFDIIGPLPMIPRALRDGRVKDVAKMALGAVIGLPIGLYLLTLMSPLVFRWVVSLMALFLLALLVSGWRYRRQLSDFAKTCVGVIAGVIGGSSGAGGPPVILFYMSGPEPVSRIRANILMFLVMFDVIILGVFAIWGKLSWSPIMIGALLIVPYMVAGLVGQAIFDPAREKMYRYVAYVIIAGSAVAGMPIWG